jgi:hypothetical protein
MIPLLRHPNLEFRAARLRRLQVLLQQVIDLHAEWVVLVIAYRNLQMR